MRIALVVFRYGPSHGSILQTYALTRTLERMGHDVMIIDRQRPVTVASCILFIKRVISNILRGELSIYDFYVGEFPRKLMGNLNFFIDKELRKQTITITSDSKLKKIGKADFDAFIVGSDQTWRPIYVYDIYNYFLDFVPQERNVKRLSYAASFGTSDWEYTDEQESKCRELIRRFDAVSVREEKGLELCLTHFRIKAELVLDPTLLLTKKEYMEFVSERKESRKYLGYNILDLTNEKFEIINNLSISLGLEKRQLVKSTGSIEIMDRIQPSISEWLAGIYNAEIVVTDSFHATVFSIIFHKNFITIGNKARGMERFLSLLKIVGLEDRLFVNSSDHSFACLRRIDWDAVDSRINEFKKRSISFISASLNDRLTM